MAVVFDEPAEVHRAEVADGGLVLVRDLDDLGAEVGQVHGLARLARLVALLVRRVLERHPAVAGLGKRPHHPRVELACCDLTLVEPFFLCFEVGELELLAVEVDKLRHLLRVEQRPRLVRLDAAHEQIGDPVGEVDVPDPAFVVAGVVAQLQELLDVGVPRLEVDARRAESAAAVVYESAHNVIRLDAFDLEVVNTIRCFSWFDALHPRPDTALPLEPVALLDRRNA